MPKKVLRSPRAKPAPTATTVAFTFLAGASLAGCSMFAMSQEDAAQRYLAIVCPSNARADALNEAWYSEDLAHIHEVARAAADAYRASARQLQDDSTNWPAEVSADDLETLANSYLGDLAITNNITSATTLADARVLWPNDPAVGEASQRVRLALDLSSDTSIGCE